MLMQFSFEQFARFIRVQCIQNGDKDFAFGERSTLDYSTSVECQA